MTLRDISVVSSRSGLFEKTVATQTSPSIPRPTNQRNNRLYSICSINCRVVLNARLWRDADREQGLDQARPDQPLRRDRGPPKVGVKRPEFAIQADLRIIHDLPDLAQRVPRRDPRFKAHIAEKRPARLARPARDHHHPCREEGEACSQTLVEAGLFQRTVSAIAPDVVEQACQAVVSRHFRRHSLERKPADFRAWVPGNLATMKRLSPQKPRRDAGRIGNCPADCLPPDGMRRVKLPDQRPPARDPDHRIAEL